MSYCMDDDEVDKLDGFINSVREFMAEMMPDIDDTFDKNKSRYFLRLQMVEKLAALADEFDFTDYG